MEISTLSVDLAKNAMHVSGLDARGAERLRRRVSRRGLSRLLAELPACRVVFEACSGAHHWGREAERRGHQAILIPPHHVRGFRWGQKNDANDALAIGVASMQPTLPTGRPRPEQAQGLLALHRLRERWVRQRTALANQLRGLMAEQGKVAPRGLGALRGHLRDWLSADALPAGLDWLLAEIQSEWQALDERIARSEAEIARLAQADEAVERLQSIPGIGPLSASALRAYASDGGAFRSGRQMAAWVGLIPRQHSTGGKARLGGITRRGPAYLRTLLIQGAHAVIRQRHRHQDRRSRWLDQLVARVGVNKAAVALANRNTRVAWRLLRSEQVYHTLH